MMLCACRWGEQLGKDRLGRSHLCTALTGSPWQKLSRLLLKQICRLKGLSAGTDHLVRSSRSMDSMFQGVKVCLCKHKPFRGVASWARSQDSNDEAIRHVLGRGLLLKLNSNRQSPS